ncbi:protein CHAPERONE-LIKE PROTEIN OF POR1, chloroplastic-like [Magnolia sinica]|uniref:protein CHAPERONE-LIKE PROTEIN OF POR1, chloroplastic-like n=1 Tax=Magnolia sinica TaxID=86752 RepID=UPI00265932BB|nr:protein CHAPERONE-LIKE PROTEIN OF POR1, chloroplastic-like [Magnolia sinica]
MAAALSTPPKPALLYRAPTGASNPILARRTAVQSLAQAKKKKKRCWGVVLLPRRRLALTRTKTTTFAGSRADDSAPFEMSVENAMKVLGVAEGASFDDILRAKNSILASCKDDQDAVAQVEAAYDMLLMQSLTQRRAGKVMNSNIRYADVKPIRSSGTSSMPQWVQSTVKNAPVSIEAPSPGTLGINAGVYGAMMVFTFISEASTSSVGPYAGADVPGLILATGFGASLYFLTKKNIKLGKAALLTIGSLIVGAAVGSVVENWLQVTRKCNGHVQLLSHFIEGFTDGGRLKTGSYMDEADSMSCNLKTQARDPTQIIWSCCFSPLLVMC